MRTTPAVHVPVSPVLRGLPAPGVALAVALLLSACAGPVPKTGSASGSTPVRPPLATGDRDGAEANPPPDLDRVPDAEPKVEQPRAGGPNKPYAQSGRQYVPLTGDPAFAQKGLASWYGRKFHGRPTASGETYNMYAMTAAHPTLPIPSYVRVRNPANAREVIVRVNDRGPFHSDRIIDLSYTAALRLDLLRGVRPVEIERITHEQIRAGTWRRGAEAAATAIAAAPASPLQEDAAPPAPDSPAAEPVAPDAAPPSARAFTQAAKGFWVQVGAFRQAAGAVELQRQVERDLEALRPLLAIFDDRSVHRLQLGPYRTRSEAQGAAEQLRRVMQLVPVVLERR